MKALLYCCIFAMTMIFVIDLHSQNVGVGTEAPLEFFSVGATSQFRVNANGNLVRINNVQYNFPAAQATSGSILANDGNGNLSWTQVTTGNISATGTANNTTFLRGDGAWADPAGGGGGGGTLVFDITTTATVGVVASTWTLVDITSEPMSGGIYSVPETGLYVFSVQGTMQSTANVSIRIFDGTASLGGLNGSISDTGLNSGLRNYVLMQFLTAGQSIRFQVNSTTTPTMQEIRIIAYRL